MGALQARRCMASLPHRGVAQTCVSEVNYVARRPQQGQDSAHQAQVRPRWKQVAQEDEHKVGIPVALVDLVHHHVRDALTNGKWPVCCEAQTTSSCTSGSQLCATGESRAALQSVAEGARNMLGAAQAKASARTEHMPNLGIEVLPQRHSGHDTGSKVRFSAHLQAFALGEHA